MFGEGNRFPFAQKMVVNNIGKKQPVSPTGIMVAVIRAWSDISKGIMALYLAVLEIELGIGSSERDIEKFGFTMRQAEKVLKRYEDRYGEVIRFRDENGKFNLKILAGGQLCMLKHEQEVVKKILMRLGGYKGVFPE
ncbi:hypothetical protein BRADI_5g27424v3 [Brachypodium distachyon]|uniref:Uncharacterized protein n=1 Tax=Brachypodium distachyon TaxID=15368 RepID=A0A2K2CJM2_BRADI|nr:hypothetical protein BRADI_5g27424v3 [Brachypodium distachyon]